MPDELRPYLDDDVAEMVSLKAMPRYALSAHVKGYVVPINRGAIRVFTDTVFGAPMSITEEAVLWVSSAPNGVRTELIGGLEATVSVQKYQGDRWVTAVLAHDEWMYFHVEVATKLEGAELDALVAFARDLVENG